MVVRVIKAHAESWYSECIGMCFHVFAVQGNNQFIFHTPHLFFYATDLEFAKDQMAVVPSLNIGQF